ncbi:hypothetical protein DZF79_03685 [Vibrio parahaemolyticus]|nr:hypothetical protein [Vibrio parahaemolyticus]
MHLRSKKVVYINNIFIGAGAGIGLGASLLGLYSFLGGDVPESIMLPAIFASAPLGVLWAAKVGYLSQKP